MHTKSWKVIGQFRCHTSKLGLVSPLFKSSLLFSLLPLVRCSRIFSNDHLFSSLFGSIFSPLAQIAGRRWRSLRVPIVFDRPTLFCWFNCRSTPEVNNSVSKFLVDDDLLEVTLPFAPRNQKTTVHHEPPRRPAHLLPLLHSFGLRLPQ